MSVKRSVIFLITLLGYALESAASESRIVHSRPGNRSILVFVHGVLGDGEKTWTSGTGVFWPDLIDKDKDLSFLDIYVQSFPSPVFGRSFKVDELADVMHRDMLNLHIFERYDSVYFVCHSMGGLVVRDFLLKFRDEGQKYYLSVPMVYFFATPTNGVSISKLGAFLSGNQQFGGMVPIAENDFLVSQRSAWLEADVRKYVSSFCAYEKLKVGHFILVVPEDSAAALCGDQVVPINANHITIVKPEDNTKESYTELKGKVLLARDKFSILHSAVELTTANLGENIDALRSGRSLHKYVLQTPVDTTGVAGSREDWSAYAIQFGKKGALYIGVTNLSLAIQTEIESGSERPVIISFPQGRSVAQRGIDGRPGVNGAPGTGPGAEGQGGQPGGAASNGVGGSDGPSVDLTISRLPRGRIILDVSGQVGGMGGGGGKGGDGGNGADGSPAVFLNRCRQAGGSGGNGGNGGDGGAPGLGGACGNGGLVKIHAPSNLKGSVEDWFSIIDGAAQTGAPGLPGEGGLAGFGGNPGVSLADCPTGNPGSSGRNGAKAPKAPEAIRSCRANEIEFEFYGHFKTNVGANN